MEQHDVVKNGLLMELETRVGSLVVERLGDGFFVRQVADSGDFIRVWVGESPAKLSRFVKAWAEGSCT